MEHVVHRKTEVMRRLLCMDGAVATDSLGLVSTRRLLWCRKNYVSFCLVIIVLWERLFQVLLRSPIITRTQHFPSKHLESWNKRCTMRRNIGLGFRIHVKNVRWILEHEGNCLCYCILKVCSMNSDTCRQCLTCFYGLSKGNCTYHYKGK